MKKSTLYIITSLAFLGMLFLIIFRNQAKQHNRNERAYYLLERKNVLAKTGEWKVVVAQVNTLLRKIQDDPEDIQSRLSLATLYIQEARITGNNFYYDKAAMKYVDDVLKRQRNNFEALSLKALILLSEHHFSEALAVSQKAISINPYNAFIYGTQADAYVELGEYDAAVETMEKMMSIRPDMRSYARVSYLREIHGDFPGAIEAMKLAVDAGAPGDEATAWTRVQLAHLYEKISDLANAEMHYQIALRERPHYAHAIAGLARISVQQKKYDDGIRLYLEADSLVSDFSIREELWDLYELKGDRQKGKLLRDALIAEMAGKSQELAANDSAGHYSDRELAHVYLKAGNHSKALEHAIAEYNRRPKNIDVNETLAWVYYNKSEYNLAFRYIKKAMRTNSKNPTLLYRAGLIYRKAGESFVRS